MHFGLYIQSPEFSFCEVVSSYTLKVRLLKFLRFRLLTENLKGILNPNFLNLTKNKEKFCL